MSQNTPRQNTFQDTRWSLILSANRGSDRALNDLCRIYWYPIYSFIRRTASNTHLGAEDLTQTVFSKLIRLKGFEKVAPEAGKMRTYLIKVTKHVIASEIRASNTIKRGQSVKHVAIEEQDAEGRFLAEPSLDLTPADYFDRAWGLAVLKDASEKLTDLYHHDPELLQSLKPIVMQNPDAPTYTELAQQLGEKEGTLRKRVHTMRQRFAHCIREVVADTLGADQDIDEELAYLMVAVRALPSSEK